MKKLFCVLMCIIVVSISFCGCSPGLKEIIEGNINKKGESSFENDLNTEVNNGDRFNKSIYLTKDKFFFTTYDANNNFGSQQKPFVYDLKTAQIKPMLNFNVDTISDITVIGEKMYFISYTTTSTDWGYCLLEYDINTDEIKRIFETPNTGDSIGMVNFDDTIIYTCSVSNQNADEIHEYEIHKLENGTDTILKSGIKSAMCEMNTDKNGVYFTYCSNNDWEYAFSYYIDKNAVITESDFIPEFEHKYVEEYENCEYIENKIISAKFGDYYILQDEGSEPKYRTDENDCGYKYKINYYLYDAKTKEISTLTDAEYWYYYV